MIVNYHKVMKKIAELERQKGLKVKVGEPDKNDYILIARGLSIDDELVDIWVSKTGSSYTIGVPKTDTTGRNKEKAKSFQEAYLIFGQMLNRNLKQ